MLIIIRFFSVGSANLPAWFRYVCDYQNTVEGYTKVGYRTINKMQLSSYLNEILQLARQFAGHPPDNFGRQHRPARPRCGSEQHQLDVIAPSGNWNLASGPLEMCFDKRETEANFFS